MSGIVATDLVKRFNGRAAVDAVSFTAAPGALVVLLGPSGCGKSTTLRLVAGLEEPDSGLITIAGRDVTRLPAAERRIGMVFQSYALFPHLTVAQNIVFGLEVRRVPKAERQTRLAKTAALVGLSALLERKPAQLSGGQRQRVALARAIIAEAPVCLMDEPLSNLDAQLRHEMRTEIRALQQRLGVTMLYVTHDQTEAMTMADRIILMRDGRIEQQGRPDELYDAPQTAFVARFIGSPPMNLVKRNGHLLGLRPEQMRLADAGSGDITGEIAALEYLGAETIVLVKPHDGDTLAVRVPGRASAKPGEAVGVAWHDADAIPFDPASGQRLAEAPHRSQECSGERS